MRTDLQDAAMPALASSAPEGNARLHYEIRAAQGTDSEDSLRCRACRKIWTIKVGM